MSSLKLAGFGAAALLAATADASVRIEELSLEQLSDVVITSVSKREEALASAAASIYVITGEDIRRSGATTLPEALRLAPNLQVARADANQYAITARGFNNTLANRLLVLIDGRIVYSPLFSGVFWEVQDVVLEDVQRIEVISGPGGTLWGQNAVNGVINVITKAAADTQGLMVSAGGGNRQRAVTTRYGGTLGGGGHYRAYAKYFDQTHSKQGNGAGIMDESARQQAGFRADWGTASNGFTVQGDAYQSNIQQAPGGSRDLGGANLIARWNHVREDGSTLQAQAYYDRVERDQPGTIREELDIFNAEFQHGLNLGHSHRFLWGASYRYAHDHIDNLTPFLGFLPPTRGLTWYSAFAQNEWRIVPSLALTLGVKAEHNDYSGLEWLPNARVAWQISPERLLWSAASRAVRAPSRIDRELFAPTSPPFVLGGGPQFRSEVSNVYEIGYRAQETRALSYSMTAFYHDHQRLRSFELTPGGGVFDNRMEGTTKGIEAWGAYRVTPSWKIDAGWVEMRQSLRAEPGSTSTVTTAGLGNDPHRWITLRSAFDLAKRYELDIMARYVSELPNPQVPSYTAVDARLGWKATPNVELSLLLQNLFDRRHPEWGPAANRAEYGRGIFFKVVLRQ
ncbi:MAG TPA: TonB-dependent receptor [Burkholderiales bacterium]|nr:TonB-dependent receptor [Burkholderiales bacterium]